MLQHSPPSTTIKGEKKPRYNSAPENGEIPSLCNGGFIDLEERYLNSKTMFFFLKKPHRYLY
jgi:hypothetical protein